MHDNIHVMEKDALLAYQRADENDLFRSRLFRNACFSNMYRILGASWWGDGQNRLRGLYFVCLSLITYPPSIIQFFKRLFR